jgi:hypothetical protein
MYLAGGKGNVLGLPAPTAFRFFCGAGAGNTPGNIMGYDNISVSPGQPAVAGQIIPATLVPDKVIKGVMN